MAKQVARDSKVPIKDLLKPFDVAKFGSEEDPCFGKLHDLNSDECQICGDVEICGIATMQNQLTMRQLLETNNKYKDLEEVEMIRTQEIKEFIKVRRERGISDAIIRAKLKTRFNLTYGQTKLYLK